jgi:hypothetical protein
MVVLFVRKDTKIKRNREVSEKKTLKKRTINRIIHNN